jgi:hypothetical protein
MPKSWDDKFKAAPLIFQVKDWFEFFRQASWQPKKVITSADEAQRIHRSFPLTFPMGLLMRALPQSMRQKILSTTGAVLMEKMHAVST